MINYSFSMYEFEYFLLILARVASFVFVAPFFSTNNTPKRVRAAFSFFFAMLIYEVTMPHQAMEYRTVLELQDESALQLLIADGRRVQEENVRKRKRALEERAQLLNEATKEETKKEQNA